MQPPATCPRMVTPPPPHSVIMFPEVRAGKTWRDTDTRNCVGDSQGRVGGLTLPSDHIASGRRVAPGRDSNPKLCSGFQGLRRDSHPQFCGWLLASRWGERVSFTQ